MVSEKLSNPVDVKTVWLKHFIDSGKPTVDLFEIRGSQLNQSTLQDGGVMLKVLCFSVDPYLSHTTKSNGRPISEGQQPMVGFVSGKVVASKNSNWKEGDLFGAMSSFSTYLILQKSELETTMIWKLTAYITEEQISKGVGVLGMTGSTAYAGIVDILRPNPGDTLFVSAASGAVGHLMAQIGKIYGVKAAIGSCGGEDKCLKLTENFGYDYAINYKALGNDKTSLVNELKKAAPEGIDMYFEQVGGIHFDAAFEVLKLNGRVGVCGLISTYHEKEKVVSEIPLSDILGKQLRIEGFLCFDRLAGKKEGKYFAEEMSKWMKEGKLKDAETLVYGIESWPEVFCSLFESGTKHFGKLCVMV